MKIHLIGICGTGMGPLAGLLKAAGHDVRGSDSDVYPPMSTQLAEQQIPVMDGFRAENLDWMPDVVVVGNVCTKDHLEVKAAQARGLELTSFPALLENLFLKSGHAVVVAGTHGKTTTSSLASFVLDAAGRHPSFLVGGVPQNFGRSWGLGTGSRPSGLFVVEGDEYDTAFFDKGSKFLHYQPKTAILTSVELDHVDIFSSLDAVKETFRKFVALIPESGLLVVAADSPGALEVAKSARCRVETYKSVAERAENGADWIGRPIAQRPGGRTLFDVTYRGQRFGTFDTGLPGGYNLANALAVIAISRDLGLSPDEIARGIRRFAGVKRRQETRGVAQGVTIVDDFAHHPTAVRETLRALRGRYGRGRLIAIFEPRSATSRRAVFQHEYAEAFSAADEIIIGAVNHPEKAPEGDRFDPDRLAADLRGNGVAARYLADVDKIVAQVAEDAGAGDTVVVMSSGGFGNIHDKLLSRLGDAVVPASGEDVQGVRDLLDESGLSYPDVGEHLGELLVLREQGAERSVVGCVAMEMYDDAGLLRALATAPSRRGEGFGWMLADAALGRARRRGARRVYLVTETASDFFAEKFGFQTVARELVDAAVLESSQFRASSAQATTMVLDLQAAAG